VGITALALAAACNLINGVGELEVSDEGVVAPDRDGSPTDDGGAGGDTGNGGADGPTTSPGGQLVFLASASVDGASGAYPGIVALTGGTPRAIGCTSVAAASAFELSPPAAGTGAVPNGPYRVGNLSSRAYGSTFLYLDEVEGGAPALLAANDATDCASNLPKRIDRQNQSEDIVPVFPRFAPNGARVAYFEQSSNRTARLVTVSVAAGGSANVLRSGAEVDAGNGAILWLAPPAWITNDELLWVESGPSPTYLPQTVRRGKDSASGAPQTLSSCNRYIEQIEVFVRNGAQQVAVVSAAQSWSQQNGATTTTLAVHSLAEGCAAGKNLVSDTTAGTIARDVAVSPGGAFIAFAANLDTAAGDRSQTSPLNVWIVDSLGASPPVRCSDADVATDEFAPQWLDDGTKLVWMRATRGPNGRESIWIADVANGLCTNARPALDDPSGATRYLTQANAGIVCGVSAVGVGGGPTSLVSVLGVLSLALSGCLRRRRRACSSSR
jgi:hypothetical protein